MIEINIMFKILIERHEKFPLNLIYLFYELFVLIIGFISIFFFKLLSKNNLTYTSPLLHTIGDSLEHLDYFRLKKNEYKNLVILTVDVYPTNIYLNFFLDDKDYKYYDQFLYKFFLKILLVFFDKKKNIVKRYNTIFQYLIFFNLSKVNYYCKNKIFLKKKDEISLIIKDKSKKFKSAFRYSHLNFSKISSKIEKLNLTKKYGYFDLRNALRYSKENEVSLLEKLNLKGKTYECLHVRFLENNKLDTRSSYELSNYDDYIQYLNNKNVYVVLMGIKNTKINEHFKKFSNVIDYRNSKYQSIENDLYLVKNCQLFLTQISGPIIYPVLLGKPFLAWDVVTFEDIQLYEKGFYFPKKIYLKNTSIPVNFDEVFSNEFIYQDKYFDHNKFDLKETNGKEKLSFYLKIIKLIEKNKFEFEKNQNMHVRKKLNFFTNFITYENINRINFELLLNDLN